MSWPKGFARRLRRLAWPEDRRGWGSFAILTVFVCHVVRFFSNKPRSYPDGDGFYTWVFARSLAFDGDVDLTNDYAMCGDPWGVGIDEGGHRPANPFYAGPSVYLSPLIWVLKHFVKVAADAPEAVKKGCHGPLVVWVGAFAPVALGVTIWLGYRIARRWYPEPACALAALVIGLASPLNVSGSLSWYYSHLWAALSVAIALLLAIRADERPDEGRRWLFAGMGSGLAALMRPQEGLWILVAVASVLAYAWQARADRRAAARTAALRLALLAVGSLLVFAAQIVIYWKIYASPLVIPQGKLYVQLAHAHPWLLLFGARSGFLYWTPLLWLTVIGSFVLLFESRRRALAATIVVVMIAQFYVASSALTWTGGGTLGARVQGSLAAGLIVAAAASLVVLLRWLKRRRFSAGAVAVTLLAPLILVTWEVGPAGLPFDRPVPAPQLYGGATTFGLGWIYDSVGNPFSLPMTVPFWMRYRAPPKVFDQLATDGIFQKQYRTLAVSMDTLSFGSPPGCYWSDTLTSTNPVVDGKGRFLVALYWPWVTKVRVHARPTNGGSAELRIRTASVFRTHELGTLRFDGDRTLDLAVGPGAFDSGINEVLLESDAPITLVSWQWLDEVKRDSSVHVLRAFAPKK